MEQYDDILREKDNAENIGNISFEKNWAAMEKKLNDAKKDKAIKKDNSTIKYFVAIAASLLLLFFGYNYFKNKIVAPNTIAKNIPIKSFIKPPLTWANIPYQHFEIDATKGDTLITKNGSLIIFPKNAVLHKNGEKVTGKIQIRSREFNDALDYAIAGIPMTYDSAGVKYTFISSGMIDITAYQNEEILYVNPVAKPQLNLVSTNDNRNTNLYVLDTLTGVWANKGKDELRTSNTLDIITRDTIKSVVRAIIKDGTNFINDNIKSNNTSTSNPKEKYRNNDFDYTENQPQVKPIAPQKPSNKNPIIDIKFVLGSFKELAIYDGLKFEVISNLNLINKPIKKPSSKSEDDFDGAQIPKVEKIGNEITKDVAANSDIEWENIELKNTEIEGLYKVTFTSAAKTVNYLVKPVLEGKKYDAAIKTYQQKMEAYNKIQAERVAQIKQQQNEFSKQLIQDSLQAIADELNNKKIEARNAMVVLQNEKMKQQMIDAEKKMKQQMKESQNTQNVLRCFQIDGFGYWNCDQPTIPTPLYVNASFVNQNKAPLVFNYLNVAVQNVNRLLNSYNNQLPIMENKNNCIFAFEADKLYYVSYKQFEQLKITKATKIAEIKMTEFDENKKDYFALKKVLFDL